MTPRIQKAINIFLDALNNGTLAKGTCKACAVGNLAAYAVGEKVIVPTTEENIRETIPDYEEWAAAVYGNSYVYKKKELGLEIVKKIGFTIKELYQIEREFEHNTKIRFCNYNKHSKEEIRKDQLNGLEAVINKMLQFDEQFDNVEEIFTSKAELVPL